MAGIPGNYPRTRGQKIAGIVGAAIVFGFIAYVILKSIFGW